MLRICVCFFSHRQCRCIFRDQLHLARLEDLLQQLLKCAIDRICELRVPAVEDGRKSNETDDVQGSAADVDTDKWSQPDMERLFLAVGKIFQLPFPFYQVRKIHLLRQVCNRNKVIIFTIFVNAIYKVHVNVACQHVNFTSFNTFRRFILKNWNIFHTCKKIVAL